MRRLSLYLSLLLVLILAACGKNAENEHLPTYCQTYAGFSATASRDLFELLDESGYAVNRFNYLSVISEIELSFERDIEAQSVDLSGIQCFQNLTSLTLIGRSFKDLSPIRALSNIQSIELRNTSVVSIDSFQSLSKINNLVITETKTLQNVDGVGEMTKLTTLDLSNNGLVNIGELNALVNLEHLYLNHNDIVYFPSINNLNRLRTLDISHNNIIELGDDLSGLSNLIELQASYNQICDISTLDDLESIEELDLSFNHLGCGGAGVSPDFDSLESASRLRVLKLNDNGLSSIEDLRGRAIPLEVLHLQNNEISDLTPIASYTSISELILFNNAITTIDDLSGMSDLTAIDLSDNAISDFSELRLIEGLRDINLSRNAIVFIPDLSDAWPQLRSLDLHSNALVDVSGVEGHPTLVELILYNNGLTVLEGIRNLPELERLVVNDGALESAIPLAERNPNRISNILDSFENVPSLALHTDHVLDLGFPFGPDVEIRNSFRGIITVHTIDWEDEDIRLIDADSLQMPNLAILYLSDNNLSDLLFLRDNPRLTEVYLDNNPITDLSVFQGVDTEDFDDLEVVSLSGITATDMTDAFVSLPSLEVLDLSEVPLETIEDSLQNLPFLDELVLYTAELGLIDNSFHDLFLNGNGSDTLSILNGRIGTIRDSFHRGTYGLIEIRGQVPIIPTPTIENSFHDLDVPGGTVAVIQSDFQSVTDSFLRITGGTINLEQNNLESITTSFVGSEVEHLNLSDNRLSDVPGLDQITALEWLELGNNALTTVAFIDGIPGLSTLMFYEQNDDFDQPSLLVLDGINNQPDLTEFTGDLSGVTAITGLQNSGFVFLDMSATTIESTIVNIGVDAFSGTPIQTLDLGGHEISDVAFLANLTEVEELSLGLDVADLSGFLAQPMALTLTQFTIGNSAALNDFAPLATYDILTDLTITTAVQDLSNLDGMDALVSLTLDQSFDVETITDSFNALPALNLPADYLDMYPSLNSITRSFDLYDILDTVELSTPIAVQDSFHNVDTVVLLNNDGQLTPQFDALSFTSMTSLFLMAGDYSSYGFLNGYPLLKHLTIETLSTNVIGVSLPALTTVEIQQASNAVTAIDITMAVGGQFDLTTTRTGALALDTNASAVFLSAPASDVTFQTPATTLQLDSSTNDLTLIGTDLTTLNLGAFAGADVQLQTPFLSIISRTEETGNGATTLTIESDATSMDAVVEATLLVVDMPQLSTATLENEAGAIALNDGASVLTLSLTALDFAATYATLEQLVLTSGTLADIVIDSTAFTTFDGGAVALELLDITTASTTMAISGTMDALVLDAPNLTAMDAPLGTTDAFLSTSATAFTVGDTTILNNLDLTTSNQLATIDFGDASIEFVTIDTTSSTLQLDASGELLIHVDAPAMHTVEPNAPLATIQVNDAAGTLQLDGTVTAFSLNDLTVATLTLAPLSEVGSLFVLVGSTLDELLTNDSTIESLSIATNATTLHVDAPQAALTSISATNLTALTLDTGTNPATLQGGAGDLQVNVQSGDFEITGTMGTVIFDNASQLNLLTITSGNLDSVLVGSAIVADLILSNSATTLSVTGSAITTATITGDITTLTATLPASSSLTVTSTATTPLQVTTTTEVVDVNAVADVTIQGGALHTVTFDNPDHDVSINFEGPSIAGTVGGTALVVTVDGTNITSLSVETGTTLDELVLAGLSFTTLDLTGSDITTLTMDHTSSALTLTAPAVDIIDLTALSLDTLTLTTNATMTLSASTANLTLSGSAATVILINDVLTTLHLSTLSIESLTVESNSLAVLDTLDAITSELVLQVAQDDFNLTSNAPSVTVETGPTFSWTLNSSLPGTMTITTNAANLEVQAPSTTLAITGTNLSDVSGTVDAMRLSGFTTMVLTFDLQANSLRILDPGTLISVVGVGTGTLGELVLESSGLLTLVDTATADVVSVDVFVSTTTPLSIVTSASDIRLAGAALGSTTTADVTYESTNPVTIVFDGLGNSTITLPGTTMTASGTVLNLILDAPALSTFTTTGLLASSLVIDDTTLTTLAFADASLLESLQRLEMNTLSNADMASLLAALDGTTLTLASPIVTADVYDHYYDTEYAELLAQEAIDSARYDTVRANAIDASWNAFVANSYLDHLDEPTTRSAIDTDALLTVEDYFQSYLTDAGLTEGDLDPGEDTTIRNAIQTTLDDVADLMDEPTLQAQVVASIEADATAEATAATAAIPFTIE